MASDKSIILITGGNGGIGFELARQLITDKNKHVIIGSRSIEKGKAAVSDLESSQQPGSVETVQLDVTDPESVTAAAKKVDNDHGRLDALVNNAAIASFPDSMPMHEKMRQSFETNSIGPMLTVEHFTPLLQKSTSTPRIVDVTSGAGSISIRLNPDTPTYNHGVLYYRASKSALNMVMACQAVDLGKLGIKVFAFCPGFTESNLGPNNKVSNGAKPTSEGARPMVAILEGERDDEHGGYLNATGQYGW